MTATGRILGPNPMMDWNACAIGAAAKNNGKMIPPGNLPAHANAIANSLAIPSCRAADALVNGRDGLTLAVDVSKVDRPCFVAPKAVFCPSTIDCKLPSPQNSVCG